jgi:hypothetical protein
MLAAHFEDHDTVGRWMALHLAELVIAAQDPATTTVEQRQQIVETILKVWTHRPYYPGRAPLEEFSNVLVALDRLGDDSPWKFFGLFGADTKMPDSSISGLPLVATCAELERLTRETLLRLIWLAAQDAAEENQEWLDAADKVASNLESEVSTTLERLQRQVARRRIRAAEGDSRDAIKTTTDTQADEAGAEGNAEDAANGQMKRLAVDDIVETGLEDGDDGPFILSDDEADDDETNDERNPLSATNHIKRLREMAELLNKVADALTVPESAD